MKFVLVSVFIFMSVAAFAEENKGIECEAGWSYFGGYHAKVVLSTPAAKRAQITYWRHKGPDSDGTATDPKTIVGTLSNDGSYKFDDGAIRVAGKDSYLHFDKTPSENSELTCE